MGVKCFVGRGGRQMASIIEVLAVSELFKGLSDEELEKVAALSREEVYGAWTVIFTEGSVAENFYILDEGKVALDMSLTPTPGVGRRVTVDTMNRGQSFGWSAVGGTPVYTMSARCLGPVKVIAIDGKRLQSLLDENPYLGYRVMARLAALISSRLKQMRMTLRVFHR